MDILESQGVEAGIDDDDDDDIITDNDIWWLSNKLVCLNKNDHNNINK